LPLFAISFRFHPHIRTADEATQGRIFILGALGYFKLGASLEGLRRLMSYKSALHMLAKFTEQVVPIHNHITYSESPRYQEPEPCQPYFISPSWRPTLQQGTQIQTLNSPNKTLTPKI